MSSLMEVSFGAGGGGGAVFTTGGGGGGGGGSQPVSTAAARIEEETAAVSVMVVVFLRCVMGYDLASLVDPAHQAFEHAAGGELMESG